MKSGTVSGSATKSTSVSKGATRVSSPKPSRVPVTTSIKSAHPVSKVKVGYTSQKKVSQVGKHAYPYQKARKEFMNNSLTDPKVGKDIKGWIKQEKNRVGKSGYWRSPPGFDVGHKQPGIDKAKNFQWENSSMNRRKGAKYKR